MATVDLSALTDEELDDLRRDVLIEQEERRDAERIPGLLEDLAARYVRAGGTAADASAATSRGAGRGATDAPGRTDR